MTAKKRSAAGRSRFMRKIIGWREVPSVCRLADLECGHSTKFALGEFPARLPKRTFCELCKAGVPPVEIEVERDG